jgi:demethylmenaquinone methyltransferase / 2-methoxy-6-polyprenyl-1,4-benzoquinol methylase
MTNPTGNRPLLRMFTQVPPSYDLLNRILTLGFDERWRKRAAAECLKENPSRVLDLCTGTGDLALRLRKLANDTTTVTALDYSHPMLERAKAKAQKSKLCEIVFLHGDVADLPFPDGHFNVIGIAFAFRNLTFHNPDREKFMREIHRVLKTGGRFVIVETSQPESKLMKKLFHLYLRWFTVTVGGLISGNRGAYKYLSHSASNYWNSSELSEFLIKTGFSDVENRSLAGGISNLCVATK